MNICSKKNTLKQCFFEFLGTGLITFLGIGSIAISKLTNLNFNYYEISFILGLVVSISIYFTFAISGAHLNPAITIFFCLFFKFNKKKAILYIISQIAGSFFFTIFVYLIYHNLLNSFEHKHNIIRGTQESFKLASIFCIFPKKDHNFFYDFILEIFIGTIFFIILMKINEINNLFSSYHAIRSILIGILVIVINLFLGSNNNITLNPAQDLGSRVFISLIGWNKSAFIYNNNFLFLYFLIPEIAPILGINLGGWLYLKHIKK